MVTNALAIGRVSSKKQKENNHSLDAQRTSTDRMARQLNAEILQRWEMAVSSKKGRNLKRKDLNEAMKICIQNKSIRYIFLDRVNRLGREVKYLTWYKLELELKHNVQLIFCDPSQQKLNGIDAESFGKFVQKLVEAEQENEEKSELNTARMKDRYGKGYYPLPIKLGYKKSVTPGLHTPDGSTFKLIQRAMLKIIAGTHEAKDTLTWATHQGLVTKNGKPIDMYRWMKLLKEPFYCGIMDVSDWGKQKGLHEPMINEAQHEELQYRIRNVKPKYSRTKHFNPKFPLQTLASCGICSGVKRVTGSTSSNGHGGSFDRYYCMDCKKYQQQKNVHSGLNELLEKVYLSDDDKSELLKALAIVWKEKEGDKTEAITSLTRRKIKLEEHKSKLVTTLVVADEDLKEDIQVEIRKTKYDVREIEDMIVQLSQADEGMIEFTKFALDYSDRLIENWWSLNKEELEWCQKIVFPGEIFLYEDGNFGTNELSPIYSLASNKKDLAKGPLLSMVEMPGTAPGSEK